MSAIVSDDPARFVRVSRAGGRRDRYLDRVTILCQCFASTVKGSPDTAQAEADAADAYDAFDAASSGGPWADMWVTGWDGGGIADYAHPDFPKHSRFQFTGTLYVRMDH
ncbi:hypothetical protein [Gordonia sp. NPDC003950]